ncbi:MAG: serine/threonine-protein kinase [Isosphaeraceae bacterium]
MHPAFRTRRLAPPPVDGFPQAFGDYELRALAGHGGMGYVYEAVRRDDPSQARLALKLILTENCSAAELDQLVERFRREAAVYQKLDHPHVVRLLDSGGFSEGRPFLVMEFLEGGTLKDRLVRYRDPVRAARLTLAVARGLEAVHREGIFHRDLKPANLMFRTAAAMPDDVVLTDFGLARSADGWAPLTRTGTFMGTPEFASPEQLASTRDVDGRADIFSLGAVLHYLLTGRMAFPCTRGQALGEYIAARKHQQPPGLWKADEPPTFDSEELESVCRQCLQPNPAARYPAAADLIEALEQALVSLSPVRLAQAAPEEISPSVFPPTLPPGFMA